MAEAKVIFSQFFLNSSANNYCYINNLKMLHIVKDFKKSETFEIRSAVLPIINEQIRLKCKIKCNLGFTFITVIFFI